ncbi:MAG: hypothetical protein GX432_01450 [Candidatus Atribacteria bacterium]|nr:hypothetical protein [Candidatus Atribacteria bacterium]
MRMIITMISIVIIVPILFLKLARDYPQSIFFRYFIWIVFILLILIFLSAIGGKKSDEHYNLYQKPTKKNKNNSHHRT